MENKNNTELKSLKSLLIDWKGKVSANKVVHYDNSLKFQKLHYIVGTLSIGLSAFVGSVVLYNIEKQISGNTKIVLGLISVIVAALSTIQILFRHSDRAILHKQCSSKYGFLEREIDLLLANPPKKIEEFKRQVVELNHKMAMISQDTPAIVIDKEAYVGGGAIIVSPTR